MKPPFEDLDNRRPVWLAMSDFFLDTELQPEDHDRIAAVLARSPYSMEELRRILYREVYPACIVNLKSFVGVWTAIDVDWIEEQVRDNLRKPWKAWGLLQWGRWMIWRHWFAVKRRVARIRGGPP